MKKRVKSANINVMLALLAVLFISLGYLSMQKKEGFREGMIKKEDAKNAKECTDAKGTWTDMVAAKAEVPAKCS
jgi:hypothetical protein